MSPESPISYPKHIPEVLTALGQVHEHIDAHGLPRALHHLVLLRASQMNRCGHCVQMHTREVREYGETNPRLDRLVVWDQVPDFSPAERAALEWTEALTDLKPDTDYAALRTGLRAHYSEPQIDALTATVAMINLWNRIQISAH